MPRPDITILGGGISGVTTGIVLQLMGYRTRIYTAQRLDEPSGDPTIASYWAAASAIPHSVEIEGVGAHMRHSHRLFEALRRAGNCGVRRQRHYEIFETPTGPPPYAGAMEDFRMLPAGGEGLPGAPRRPDAEAVFGWTFQVYFAEMSVYRPHLCALYEAAGGTIIQQHLTRADLPRLPGGALVNCTGLGALDLFDDPAPHRLLRGLLVYAEGLEPPRHPQTGGVFSYNYTPGPEVYATATGAPTDVYFYPCGGGAVLGGTRDEGRLADDGTWQPAAVYEDPTVRISNREAPRPILDLNHRLLIDLAGVGLASCPKRAAVGIRFMRDPARLEMDEAASRPVAHNYGHGGAGVALSWSCAVEVAHVFYEEADLPTPHTPEEAKLPDRLQRLAEAVDVEQPL